MTVIRLKISVALATYNGEKYITHQLDSLLAQTRLPDEVIIIDDCSTDRTAEIVAGYIKTHGLSWDFSVSESNSGYKRNFYNCLKKCTGDIVFLCDQDDDWYSQKIETISSFFETYKDCLAINSSFDMIDGVGRKIENFRKDSAKTTNNGLILYKIPDGKFVQVGLDTVLMYNISPGCTCAFRKSVIDGYLSTSKCKMPHDWELNLVAAKKHGLYFLNVPLTGYRLHGGNAIGLTDEHQDRSLKMRGTDETRLKVFETQQAQADIFNDYMEYFSDKTAKFADYFTKFCNNRRKILYNFKLIPCIANFFLYPKVKTVVTVHFRGLIGDMIYVFKNIKQRRKVK